jgi:hypothetical protein
MAVNLQAMQGTEYQTITKYCNFTTALIYNALQKTT